MNIKPKSGKCWMCLRQSKLTEHHIVPKILRRFVPHLNKHKVMICRPCHNKIHILLPYFYEDGSYKWKFGKKIFEVKPEWDTWSKEDIAEMEQWE